MIARNYQKFSGGLEGLFTQLRANLLSFRLQFEEVLWQSKPG